MSKTEEARHEISSKDELINYVSERREIHADFVKLDLIGYAHYFKGRNIKDAVFIDCKLPTTLKKQIAKEGAIVFSNPENSCFDIYPTKFYSPRDLYEGIQERGHSNFLDRRIYNWFIENKKPRQLSPSQLIFTRTHDTALERLITRKIRSHVARTDMLPIAIMGGHSKKRSDKCYFEVARLGRQLARRGHLIITGGGPGLMEAGNLGALCAPLEDNILDRAIELLCECEDYGEDTEKWLNTAFRARELIEKSLGEKHDNCINLSIPTWHYGHEPSNVFATHIAKFFYNSLREDGLVTLADGGIVFAEGNAGTVQEIFQDACQNYYRDKNETPTPMVFFNSQKDYWQAKTADKTKKLKPLRPLIEQLAIEGGNGGEFLSSILFSESTDEILAFFENYHGENRDTVSLGHYWRLALNGHALGDPEK